MGKLLKIKTNMQWAWGVVFQVKDEFNGHQRGIWYYREPLVGNIRGPFQHFDDAEHCLHLDNASASRV